MKSAVRWFAYSVALAFVPIALSWLFLPSEATVWDAISHGELAILAQALAASSIGVLFDRESRPPGFELLVFLNLGVLLAGLVTLAAVVGGATNLTADQVLGFSVWLLGIATFVGGASNIRPSAS